MSQDTANRPPYSMQWLGLPYGNNPLYSLAVADGIIFDRQTGGNENLVDTLWARDANNSRLLWEKKLDTDILRQTMTSVMIASDEKLFLRDKSRVLVLDPLTGEERKVITPDGRPDSVIVSMLYQNGVLYILSGTKKYNDEMGKKTKNMFFRDTFEKVITIGNRISAWDVEAGSQKWQIDTGEEPVNGPSMALNSSMLFFGNELDYVRSISLVDGKEIWRTDFTEKLSIDMANTEIDFTERLSTDKENTEIDFTEELSIDSTDVKLSELLGKRLKDSLGLKYTSSLPTVRVSDKWVGVGFQASRTLFLLEAGSGKFVSSVQRTSNSWAIDANKLYVANLTKELQEQTEITPIRLHQKHGAVYDIPTGKFEAVVPGYGMLRCSEILITPTTFMSAVDGPTYDRLNDSPIHYPGAYMRGRCWMGNTPIVAEGLHFSKGGDSCNCFHTHRGFLTWGSTSTEELNPPRSRFEPEYLSDNPTEVKPLAVQDDDWYASRGGYRHRGSSPAKISLDPKLKWQSAPMSEIGQPLEFFEFYTVRPPRYHNSEAIIAGDLVFTASELGLLTCLDAENGQMRWRSMLGSRIFGEPVVMDGRVFVGTGDGYVYAYEAVSGRPLWRFRTAPEEQLIMAYGHLQSRWPTTGILVKDNILYVAAGLDAENTMQVFALEADTGKLKWHNDKPKELYTAEGPNRACAAGEMTIIKDQLWVRSMYTPCVRFDINTGKTIPVPERLDKPVEQYTNYTDGMDIGVVGDNMIMQGGRPWYFEDFEYVTRRNQYFTFTELDKDGQPLIPEVTELLFSSVTPAWDDRHMLVVPYKIAAWNGLKRYKTGYHRVACWDVPGLLKHVPEVRERYQDLTINDGTYRELRINDGFIGAIAAQEKKKKNPDPKLLHRRLEHPMTIWGPEEMMLNSLALAENAALIVERTLFDRVAMLDGEEGVFHYKLLIKDRESGKTLKTIFMSGIPGHNSLSIDSKGNIYVAMQDGSVACYGTKK